MAGKGYFSQEIMQNVLDSEVSLGRKRRFSDREAHLEQMEFVEMSLVGAFTRQLKAWYNKEGLNVG